MYEIYADGALIHASGRDDLRLSKGEITLELDKAGSFVFSLPAGHPYRDAFTKLKTVITVYRSGRIVFRGRILDDVTDYWNTRTFICEGELSFLQDSIVRPFTFTGTPAELFRQFVEGHNAQVDEFKRFKVGAVSVTASSYIDRDAETREAAVSWAEGIAANDIHGYSQDVRWGPHYDCSSLVITAWERAGVLLKTKGATFTGNMEAVMLANGFEQITSGVNLSTGAGLQRGDVILNPNGDSAHVAMSVGGGEIVEAYRGDVAKAKQIRVADYYFFGQDRAFRYIGTGTGGATTGDILRSNTAYETTLSNMNSRLLEDATGGHFYITHGYDGTDPVPTIHYLADFTAMAAQAIEFGGNLLDFTKTVKAEDMATAIIPLGAAVDDGDTETDDPQLTIASVNGGVDYVYSPEAVAQFGWIFKVVEWEDVTEPANLKKKAREYLNIVTQQTLTLELSAVDLHLLDRSVESYSLCEYVRVSSPPHNFEDMLLCTKQSLDVLNPASDSMVLGQTVETFTDRSSKMFTMASRIGGIKGRDGRDGTVYTVYYLTAPAAGWEQQTNGTFIQNVAVEGVTVTDSGYVDLDLRAADVGEVSALQSAWALIGRVQTVDGVVRLTCYNKAPAIDLPVQVGVFK